MLSAVIEFLRCPLCSADLQPVDGGLRCGHGHCFDVAKQGYVNLLAGNPAPGSADTAAMVEARDAFLRAGHFAPLAERIAGLAAAQAHGKAVIVDAGAGTGYYLDGVLSRLPLARGIALDISKFALRRAAKISPRVGAVVWDLWRPLPLRTGIASLVMNVFAPRNGAEFRRILQPGGALLVVTPTPRHLQELVTQLGLLTVDVRKEERLEESLAKFFQLEAREELGFELHLPRAHALALVQMGPSAHHLTPEALAQRGAALAETVSVSAAFTLSLYRAAHSD